MNPIIHIVDDDAEALAATSLVLAKHGYESRIYSSAVEFLIEDDLDQGCILLDLKMPHIGGGSIQEELARRGVVLPLIVMGSERDLGSAVEAMKRGAVNFVVKPPGEEELLSAVRRAFDQFRKGEDRRRAKAAAAAKLRRLSRRERQILQGLLGGLSNKAIARRLGLSPRTVEMHRANMMSELAVGALPEALRLAIDADLPPLADESPEAPPPESAQGLQEEQEPERRAQRRALEDRALVELSAWGADAGTWDFDLQSRTIGLSARCRELHGVQGLERLTVGQWAATVHPEDVEGVRSVIRRAIASGGCHSEEFRTAPPGGECRHVLIVCKRVDDPAKRPVSVVGFTQELAASGSVLRLRRPRRG